MREIVAEIDWTVVRCKNDLQQRAMQPVCRSTAHRGTPDVAYRLDKVLRNDVQAYQSRSLLLEDYQASGDGKIIVNKSMPRAALRPQPR